MKLAEYVAQLKKGLLSEIEQGRKLSLGSFDEARLARLRTEGRATLGPARFAPDEIEIDILFDFEHGSSEVLTVKIPAPERIVFMPVPSWVMATIWQGEVSGSYHFDSEKDELLREFVELLGPEGNPSVFTSEVIIGRS